MYKIIEIVAFNPSLPFIKGGENFTECGGYASSGRKQVLDLFLSMVFAGYKCKNINEEPYKDKNSMKD